MLQFINRNFRSEQCASAHSQSNLLAFYCCLSVGRQQQHERGASGKELPLFKGGYKIRNKYADALKSRPTGLQVNIMQALDMLALHIVKAPH